MMRAQPVIVAYHEAGHAVMAMAQGFDVLELSNVQGPTSSGHARWQIPENPSADQKMGVALVFASGLAADSLHAQVSGAEDEVKGGIDDRAKALVYLEDLGHHGQYGAYLAMAAKFLMRADVWEWVEGFAELMIAAGTINGREVLYRASQQVPRFENEDRDLLRYALGTSRHREF